MRVNYDKKNRPLPGGRGGDAEGAESEGEMMCNQTGNGR